MQGKEINCCPNCGSVEIGQGHTMQSIICPSKHKLSLVGSSIMVSVCIKCGSVFNIRVKEPQLFK